MDLEKLVRQLSWMEKHGGNRENCTWQLRRIWWQNAGCTSLFVVLSSVKQVL